MKEQLKKGDRVEAEEFGEGTIVGISPETGLLTVAFSELETFDLPSGSIRKIAE